MNWQSSISRQMNFLLLVPFLICAFCTIAATYPNGITLDPDVPYLSKNEVTRLRAIFRTEDNPEMVSVIWGKCRRVSDRLVFLAMIIYHRNESFKFCFHRAVFTKHEKTILKLLRVAYRGLNYEIFSYILSQDFPIGKIAIWKRSWLWKLDELKNMATRHPERIPSLVPHPDIFARFTNDVYVRLTVDFIEHCARINAVFASDKEYNPTYLLFALIQNENLNEGEMERSIQRLILFGAEVDQVIMNKFKRHHPEMLDVHQLLNAATPNIKEPNCD
jgi:hypothetical protein